MPDTPQVGWVVRDPDGNIIDSGPVMIAQAAGELADALKALGHNQEKENG